MRAMMAQNQDGQKLDFIEEGDWLGDDHDQKDSCSAQVFHTKVMVQIDVNNGDDKLAKEFWAAIDKTASAPCRSSRNGRGGGVGPRPCHNAPCGGCSCSRSSRSGRARRGRGADARRGQPCDRRGRRVAQVGAEGRRELRPVRCRRRLRHGLRRGRVLRPRPDRVLLFTSPSAASRGTNRSSSAGSRGSGKRPGRDYDTRATSRPR